VPQPTEFGRVQHTLPPVHVGQTQMPPPSPIPPEPLSAPLDELLETPLDEEVPPLEDDDAPLDEDETPLDEPLLDPPPLLEPELVPDLHASVHASATHPSSESPSLFSLAE
jgi:hypothetical protein